MAAVEKESSFKNDDVLTPETRIGHGLIPVGSSCSGLSSPFGSEFGSTEAESEEEDDDDEFMAELYRQMADYMLGEDEDGSSREECPSHKFRVSSECTATQIAQHNSQAFADEQKQEVHLYKVENQPSLETQFKDCKQGASIVPETFSQPERKKPNKVQNRTAGVLGPAPAVWPPVQTSQKMNYGSGMRAVFLGGPGPKTRTSGTGVFLPRGASDPPEVRKKLGCSTVLIPARVLQTLQLHFEKVKNQSQSNGSAGLKSYTPQYDLNSTQAKRSSQSQSHSTNKTHEICLPQEWTY